jgi:hypothetical protein
MASFTLTAFPTGKELQYPQIQYGVDFRPNMDVVVKKEMPGLLGI